MDKWSSVLGPDYVLKVCEHTSVRVRGNQFKLPKTNLISYFGYRIDFIALAHTATMYSTYT